MGLFDSVREKAAELLSGASDKVSELTGAELPNAEAATDQLSQSADTAVDSATGAADGLAGTMTGTVNDTVNDTVAGATEGFTGAVDGVTGAASEAVEPYRP